MSRYQWRQIEALYQAALECDGAARDRFLDEQCGDDRALREEIESLLRHDAATHAFFDAPAVELPALGKEQSLIAARLRSYRTNDLLNAGGMSVVERTHDDRLAQPGEEHFPGTERFQVVRRLGAGGMGVVYEVHDHVRDEVVALKTLRRTSAADLYRLKREFRSLADVTHANLVCLYELFVEDARCFFTMELIDGVSFVDYAKRTNRTPRAGDRLIAALRQLIDGVSALHQRRKLHRDIKPSNVLVTSHGRVVILDFGLIAEVLPERAGETTFVSGGTPAYMSPEEASGRTPTEASDWYSIGATLYEALTGTIPFAGSLRDVLHRKGSSDPLPPTEVIPDVPHDLSDVCMGLLCRNPDERLSGPEALRRLAHYTARLTSETIPATVRETPFVGRDRQLQALSDSFRAVVTGHAAAVSVHGPSGIGKSALVRRFLSQVVSSNDVVVLSGRCYENEFVPYKALDGAIDDLSRYLGSIPRHDVETLMPHDVPALTRVFPVLLQVSAIAQLRHDQEPETADPFALRRRAFEALRRLLGRLANRQSLVMCIDDLQWADADSAVLLEELLRPPSSPAMLTLLCFRSEETAAKPFLRALLERAGRDVWSAVSLEPMTEDEADTLIGALLPADAGFNDEDRRRLTREAGGSPFVLEQLAHYAGVNRMEPSQAPTFSEMFDMQLAALSTDARRFIETLAICGRPMSPDLICDACAITREKQSLVARLRSSRFIRSSGSSERIETYHDRIREVLAAQLAPGAVRRIHNLMVRALVARRSEDCEALFEHYRGAGDAENASIQAALAAEKAGTALAFDRAALFYRHALMLTPAAAAARAWEEGLAQALANAGRPADAADAYLRAATGAGHPHRVELRRRAAEQFLIGGDIDHGLDLIRAVLADIGVSVPASPYAALLQLLWRRARLRWRGLRFVARPVEDIEPDALLRIDTCWSLTIGLMPVDMITGSDFSVHNLHLALDAGEPYRIARAMAIESAARGLYPTGRTFSDRICQQSKALAESVGNPHALALCVLADSITAILRGEWKTASTLSQQALAILRDQCVGFTWEVNMAENVAIWSLMYQGEFRELSQRVPVLLADARSRGNLYIATELCTRSNFVWLAADDPDEGERQTVESIARWSHEGFHRQHYSARLARVQTALYRGEAEEGWRLHGEQEAMLRRSLLTRVQVIRLEALYLQSRVALAMAAKHGSSSRFLSIARAAAQRIALERMPWSDPIALLLSGAIAYVEGHTPAAVRYLHDAADGFARADMNLYAAVTRRRIGELQDDARGRELQGEAAEWMAAQHIKNPGAMTRMLAPGFHDRP